MDPSRHLAVKTLGLGTYHGYRRRYIRRYRHYRPATFHLILGLATKVSPAPLSKIVADPVDNKTKIIGLPEPKPADLPKDMLHSIKTRAFKKRGFLLPEDYPDD